MKIENNKELKDYINSLIETNELNMSMSDIFLDAIISKSITSKKEMDLFKSKFDATTIDLYKNKLLQYWGIDEEEDEEIIDKYLLSSLHEADINKYLSNPYYQKFEGIKAKEKDYELVTDHYEPYELFSYQDMGVEKETFVELNSVSFFKEKFPFLALNHKGVTWMSVTPNEIETMEKAVKAAHGKVLVLGLGLGYYPYMISLKEEVKEITIIENDKNIIEIFRKYLFPHFDRKDKIKIIEADAFSYLKEKHSFDYTFVDLWHDPLDGIELYLKAKKLENKGEYFYWLESSMYLLLRRCFISLLQEQLEGLDESNYKIAKTPTDKVINNFYQKTKNLALVSKKQLQDILSDNSLIELAI